ncbi:MAG: serine/threonine-protein kinase [Acidimicrobiia bacterium]
MERIADYELVRSLGQGNNGEFFLAVPPDRLPVDAEHVAVKVLSGPSSDDAFRRATRELRIFASVRSPYLVTLYDAGQEGGRFFYSMAYFPLGSLEAPARPLIRLEILRAIAHVSRAAHALHEAGVVHRGIKPANILLEDDGAKLSDLGLAQLLTPGLSVTGIGPIESLEYVDPGTLRGDRPSRASDIWSLGATLHRALSGTGVYGDLSSTDVGLAVRQVLTTPPGISESLPPSEVDLIARCLDPDPAQRLPTAEALADEVEALAAAEASA